MISFLFKNLFKYFKFLVGGGISLLISLALTYLLTEYVHLWHMTSFALVLGVEVIFLFLYHSVITFKKRGKFLLFIFIILFISDLNWIFVYYLSEVFEIYYVFAIILSAGVISILNFSMNKLLVFND